MAVTLTSLLASSLLARELPVNTWVLEEHAQCNAESLRSKNCFLYTILVLMWHMQKKKIEEILFFSFRIYSLIKTDQTWRDGKSSGSRHTRNIFKEYRVQEVSQLVICAGRQRVWVSFPASTRTTFHQPFHVRIAFISLNTLTIFDCAHVVTVASHAFPHILPVETLLLSHFTLSVYARTDFRPTCAVTCICVFLSHHILSLLKVGLFFYLAL